MIAWSINIDPADPWTFAVALIAWVLLWVAWQIAKGI